MRKGEATRARIVEEAARQASVRGLRAVSLADLAEAVGLSKSGVFKHFEDKDDLHMAVLTATVKRYLALIWTPALQLPAGLERVSFIFERWLDWVEQDSGPGGCLIMQASREFDDQPGAIRDYLKDCHVHWQKHLAAELKAAAAPQPTERDAVQAAFDMKSYILGFAEQRRLMDDRDSRTRARSAFNTLLQRLTREPIAA
jgi:AcrR family transcriptional regulator